MSIEIVLQSAERGRSTREERNFISHFFLIYTALHKAIDSLAELQTDRKQELSTERSSVAGPFSARGGTSAFSKNSRSIIAWELNVFSGENSGRGASIELLTDFCSIRIHSNSSKGFEATPGPTYGRAMLVLMLK